MDEDSRFLVETFLDSESKAASEEAGKHLLSLSLDDHFLAKIDAYIFRLVAECVRRLPATTDLLVNLTAYIAGRERPIRWDIEWIKAIAAELPNKPLSHVLTNMFICMEEPVNEQVQHFFVENIDKILNGIIAGEVDSPLLCNLTVKCPLVRAFLWQDALCRELLLQTIDRNSRCLRYGSASIRNCCLDTALHDQILQNNEIIVKLVLPLTDASYKVSPEENLGLPIELQYIAPESKCEQDPETRKNLLEALYLLCATKHGRQAIRDSNIYCLLRELFNTETEEDVKDACLNLINVIIADEPSDPAHSNLMDVEVPAEALAAFSEIKTNSN